MSFCPLSRFWTTTEKNTTRKNNKEKAQNNGRQIRYNKPHREPCTSIGRLTFSYVTHRIQ